jgi:hypothetical protein
MAEVTTVSQVGLIPGRPQSIPHEDRDNALGQPVFAVRHDQPL